MNEADDRQRITIDAAFELAGRAIHGDCWFGLLTARDDWLIQHYVEGSPGASSVRWDMGGRCWAIYPGDAELRKEVERAVDRRDSMPQQIERVEHWLQEHGFDLDTSSLDREALFLELARAGLPAPGPMPARESDERQNPREPPVDGPVEQKTLNERKRQATIAAIQEVNSSGQVFDSEKCRENAILAKVKKDVPEGVTDRYVRKIENNTRNKTRS